MALLLLTTLTLVTAGVQRLLGQDLTVPMWLASVAVGGSSTALTAWLSPELSFRYIVWACLLSAFWGMALGLLAHVKKGVDAYAVTASD